MATRRGVLAGLMAAALPRLSWADAGQPAYLAAARQAEGSYVLQGLSAAGQSLFSLPLPARGHAAAAHPSRPEAVAFARRPGSYALVIDCARGQVLAQLTPPTGRQFNGHGCFSADGAVLYTSEQLAEGSAGRIGLWDAATWQRMGEFASGGIGPHDLRRRADGGLVVANGGIETDATDRSKLNIPTMQPSIAWLSAEGEMQDQVQLDPALRQNSIRHLALLPDGGVGFAMQWEGDPDEVVPLMGVHRRGSAPVLFAAPETEAGAMKGYAGSIALDGAGGQLAMTSPKGGVVQVFSVAGQFVETLWRADASGVAPATAGFVLTDGGGGVSLIAGEAMQALAQAPLAWDNHLVALA